MNDREREPADRQWIGPLTVVGITLLLLAIVGIQFGLRTASRLGWWSSASHGSSWSFRPTESVEDRIAQLLASWMVEPARAGEALTPHIQYEQAWPQWAFLLVLGLSAALVIWLYRREGAAPTWYKMMLASLRIALILVAMFLLSEAVLSVERTGLPTFVVMIDDSASGQVVDQYADPKVQTRAAELAKIADRNEANRLAVGLGWLLRDDAKFVRELMTQQKVKFYRVSDSAVPVAEINQPTDLDAALRALRKLEPSGEQSRLGDGVQTVLTELRGVPPTAILLLSDGRTTDGLRLSEASEIANKEGVPLYTIGLGDVRPARDLELTDLRVDEVVYVQDIVRFDARLLARGFVEPVDNEATSGTPKRPVAAPQVAIHLKRRRADSKDTKALENLQTIRVPIPPDGRPQPVEISHKPEEPGQFVYVLEVEPQPRELQLENNRIERTIDVRKDQIKVLIVEGEPRWEFRYLKTYLERDSSVEMHYVLQSSDENASTQDRSALAVLPPKDGEKGLFSYDVVILGDVDPAYLNNAQLTDLAEFVTKKGGGLLLIAGELFNPLAFKGKPLEPLLPILLNEARNPTATGGAVDSFHPTLTAEGRGHPIFRLGDDEASSLEIWNNLPMSDWYFEAPRKQPAAVVLAEHPGKIGPEGRLPILIYQFSGAGKVMFSAIDDTWRWRLRVGDRFFGRYWVQTIRFLARSKLLGQKQAEVVTDRRRYHRGQPVQIQVRFPNPGLSQNLREVNVQVLAEGQGPRRLALRPSPGSRVRDLFEGSLPPLVEGRYKVELLPPPALSGTLPSTTFQVDPPAGEFVRVSMDTEDLASAARLTGGQFFRWDQETKHVEAGRARSNATTSPATPGPGDGLTGEPKSSAGDGAEPLETGTTSEEPGEKTLLELLPRPQKVPLDNDPPMALWNTWPVLFLFLGLITAEWVLRKRKQMV